MDKKRKFEKNEELLLSMDDLGKEGEGIGHIDGYTLFVKGALPAETVRVRMMKAKKNMGFARLLEVLEPSPKRCEPLCPVAAKCGGCTLQHLSYEGQLEMKEKKVKDCLTRIGGVDLSKVEWLPILGMYDGNLSTESHPQKEGAIPCQAESGKSPWHYRNKAQFPVRADAKGNPVTGFYAGKSHRLVPITECGIQHPVINEVVRVVLNFLKDFHIKPYEEETHSGLVRHIYARRGYYTGECMVCLVINGQSLPHKEQLVQRLRKINGFTGLLLNRNRERTNVILGEEMKLVWGRDYIEDTIGKLRYRISAQSFYQVNPLQTSRLYETALSFADLHGDEVVWDLYCGIGTISLFLASQAGEQKGGRVIGVEIVPEAIENAKQNARLNGIQNVEFYCGAAEDVVPELLAQDYSKFSADVVVVDPPRKGCDKKLLQTMIKMQPEKIVYVSCDPATLARDVKVLGESGYEVKKVRACDMFPQGGHVETVCLLSKLKVNQHIEVELEMDELDLTAAESKATYKEIKEYVLEHTGLKVSHLYIAQVKRKADGQHWTQRD